MKETPIDESSPVVQFQYTYHYPFSVLAQAFLSKYSYEPRTHLTTASNVQQLDDDRIMFYRKVESVFTDEMNYERVIIDRRDGGKITSELIKPRTGGERLFERGVIEAKGDDQAVHNHYIYDHQGIKTWKVEFFKNGVERLIKAIKFSQFEKEL